MSGSVLVSAELRYECVREWGRAREQEREIHHGDKDRFIREQNRRIMFYLAGNVRQSIWLAAQTMAQNTKHTHTHTKRKIARNYLQRCSNAPAARCPLNVWLGIYIARIDATGSSIQNRYVRLRAICRTFWISTLNTYIHGTNPIVWNPRRKESERERKKRPNNK